MHFRTSTLFRHRILSWTDGCLVLALLAFGVGCSSSGKTTRLGGGSSSSAQQSEAVLVKAVSDIPDSDQERSLLQSLVASGLSSSGKFKRVSTTLLAPEAGALKVVVTIKRIGRVGDASRMMLGILAGRASITVDVEITGPVTDGGRTFEVEGKSSGGGPWSGTTDQAIQRAAEQVVTEVLGGTK